MHSKICFFILLLVCAGNVTRAQQEVQFSQYVFNGLTVNPAYAGYREDVNLNATYRKQWVGFDGAPQTGVVSIDGVPNWSADGKVGLGAQVLWDKLGPQEYFSFTGSYSYRIPLDETGARRLSLGIGVNISQYSIRGDVLSLVDENDLNAPTGRISTLRPDASFGVYYYTPTFYAGVSVMQLFAQELNNKITISGENMDYLTIKKTKHYYFTSGVLLNLSELVKLKPSIMVKEDFKGPTSIDLNVFALVADRVWIGGSYRSAVSIWNKGNLESKLEKSNAASAMLEYFATDRLRIGYAYDFTLSGLANYQNGSHEISIGVLFPRKKSKERVLSPRYF